MSRASRGLALMGLLLLGAGSAAAQQSPLRQHPDSAPARPIVYAAWRFDGPPAMPDSTALNDRLRLDPAPEERRHGHWLLGGVIGAAVGILTCTVISNLVNSDVEGTTTCDTKAYLGFGAGGFVVGALVGSLIK